MGDAEEDAEEDADLRGLSADLRGLKRCVFRLIRPPIPIDLAAYSGDIRPFAAITAGACPHDVQDVVAVSIPSV
jgi:hypothetical protein